MNRLARFVFTGTLILLVPAVVIGFFYRTEPPSSLPQKKIAQKQYPTLKSELQRIKAEIAKKNVSSTHTPQDTFSIDQTITKTQVAASANEITNNTPADAATAESASPLQAERDAADTPNPAVTHINNRFLQEKVDEYWSEKTSELITTVFDNTGQETETFQSALNNLECRSTVCRAEVLHENQQSAEEFALMFPLKVAAELPRITYQLDPRNDGRVGVVMYLSTNTP